MFLVFGLRRPLIASVDQDTRRSGFLWRRRWLDVAAKRNRNAQSLSMPSPGRLRWVFAGFCFSLLGFDGISIRFYQIPSGLIGFQRLVRGLDGFFIVFFRFDWVLLGLTGFCWVWLGFVRFDWVLLGLTGFCWVLLGFVRFDWVLLGLTGFC